MRTEKRRTASLLIAAILVCLGSTGINGQKQIPNLNRADRTSGRDASDTVRPVTIPITIRAREAKTRQEMIPADLIVVREDGEEQRILSIRAMGGINATPISFAVLIQDDVVSSLSNEIKAIANFIRGLPQGSRVFVGYIRSGSLQVRQKFTTDLERAASALRIPIGSASAAPYNPYVEIIEGLKRFESLPAGRRAMLVISDGLDFSQGIDSTSPSLSMDLERAIREAQRQSVAIYSFYAPTVTVTSRSHQLLVGNAQSSLQRLSDETGGRAFFQGMGAPVSLDPFLQDLNVSLTRQIALTYLSTHPGRGYHRIEIISEVPGLVIDYPRGYMH